MRRACLISACILLYLTAFAQEWRPATAPPNFITDHSFGFSIDGKGYLVAGNEEFTGPSAKFLQYDPATDTWAELDSFPGAARGYAIGDVWDRKAYFGFGISVDSLLRDLWVFDPDSMKWTALASCPCDARTHPTLVANNGKIFVGLGAGNQGNMKDWWEYDIESDQWSQKTDFPDLKRHHPYQFAAGDYVYSGFGHGERIFKEWYRYDPVTDSWDQMADLPAEGRVAGTQFSYNDKGYVLSGDGDDHLSMDEGEFWEYDPGLNTWRQLPSHPGKSRWAPASFIIDGVVYLFNGTAYFEGLGSFYQAEAYKFDLDSLGSSTAKDFPIKLIRPSLFNEVQSVQLLPDSTIRIFSRSQESSLYRFNELFMVNVDLQGFNADVVSIKNDQQQVPFYSASEIFHLPLKNGSTILAANQFDCDFDPSPLIGLLNEEGNLNWHVEFDQHYINWIGLVDNDLIAISIAEDTVYVDFDGEVIELTESPEVYTHTVYVDDILVGIAHDHLSVLDSSFNAIFTQPYDSPIYLAHHLGPNTLFTASEAEVCIWKDQLLEQTCVPAEDSMVAVTAWNDEIWLASDSLLYRFDSLLNFIQEIEGPAHEKFNFISSRGDTLYSANTYFGINHSDIVLRKFLPERVNFPNTKDIGISNLTFPPELINFQTANCPFGYGLHIDSLKISIQNHSLDTIRSLEIHYDLASGYYPCEPVRRNWVIDTLNLLPFDSVTIKLTSIDLECVHLNENIFCLWVSTPNGEPDVVPSNNMFCAEINLIINSVEQSDNHSIMIKPNPAKDVIQIGFPEIFIGGQMNVYNLEGLLISASPITEENMEYSLIN